MPNCGNSTLSLSKPHSAPEGRRDPDVSEVNHWASRAFTTNQPSEAGARPEPESSSCASGTARVYRVVRARLIAGPTRSNAAAISSRIAGSSIVGGVVYFSPSAMRRIVPRRIFPDRVLGRRSTIHSRLECGDRSEAFVDQLHDLGDDVLGRPIDAGLEDEEAERQLSLERVGDSDHRALRDVGVRREHLFHCAGREPVPRDVDDVVGPGHDEDVALLVDVAGVGRLVVARKLREVGPRQRSSAFQSVGDDPGGNGNFTTSAPISPGRRSVPSSPTARRSQPGTDFVGDPATTGIGSIPMQLATTGQPVSVCQ